MKYFAGPDVSLEWTSVCVVDKEGQIVRETKVLSEPDALADFLAELDVDMDRIGLEAGPLSQWLHDGMADAGFHRRCKRLGVEKGGELRVADVTRLGSFSVLQRCRDRRPRRLAGSRFGSPGLRIAPRRLWR